MLLCGVSSIGCRGASSPIVEPHDHQTKSAPSPSAVVSAPAPTAVVSAPPPSASPTTTVAVPTSYPPLTDACSSDADCASTSYGKDCCFRCETSVGDKAWVAKVEAFCGSTKPSNPCPMVLCARDAPAAQLMLGYLNANPKCSEGRCIKPH